ncbi:hypothetical protein BaRGS_00027564 [Batillaria attramentaria]|uniref:FLYWCH-type domain-containing protein n=1 Tax=Batillaria attramentaria TaxID=370345 RepID=A0ABD0K2P2_9CAEN
MDSDSSTKFIASLTKFLQSLCNGYVEFQNGVELAGHIYLSIDTGEKVDYILHEKVCKNDENSVTFISNSFHALPAEKRKDGKQQSEQSKGAQSKTSGDSEKSDSRSRDDDDDVVIVDQDSSSGGTASSRGVKRAASPSSDQKQRTQSQRNMPGSFQGSTARQGIRGNRQQPTATVTSQEQRGENFDVGDVKLEQMTTDELLSLASQVGDSSGGPSHRSAAASSNNQPPPRLRGPRGDAPAEMWIKQEVNDDADVPGGSDSGQSWPHGRDDSNSGPGGGLYPVMLHQNTAAFSPTSGFPVGFPGMPGSSASTSQHPGLGQPVPSTAGSNPYANPIPGTSQGAGAVDPAVSHSQRPGLEVAKPRLSTSNKGKRCLIVDGYKFRVNNHLKNGDLSWRCNHTSCKARVRTNRTGDMVCEITGDHNHESSLIKRAKMLGLV